MRLSVCMTAALVLAGAAGAQAQPPPSGQPASILRVAVSLVDNDLNVKPVPRHALTVRAESATPDTIRVVTGLDGKAEAQVPPGNYVVESERPVDFQGKSYRWKVAITMGPGDPKTLELSVDNAAIGRSTSAGAPAIDLPSLFKQWQGSVVTVWSDTGHGSGFVVDPAGLIVTNQHVVGNSDYAAVQFSPTLKVPAAIVVRAPDRDVAILRVHPRFVEGVAPVDLAFAQDGKAPAVEGQQVFTIGSPLNQRKVMTTGIVSKVEPKVIISDVNINHGNSGGPLFTGDGVVVGITTFGDFTNQGGPGISGIVRIDEAKAAIEQARMSVDGPAPADAQLPVEPTEAFPVEGLKAALQSTPVKPNEYAAGVGDFDVTFITPMLTYGQQYALEQAALKEKSKRTKKTTIPQPPGDPFADYKNWAEYVGEYRPVLIVDARPKLVEGFWSGFARGMAASQGFYGGPARLHFKTDFKSMKLFCGQEEVTPIHPGKVEHRVAVSNVAVRVNDITYEGFYSYGPDAVDPKCGTVKLVLYSEKDPNSPDVKVLSEKLVKKLWDDFAPLRGSAERK